MSFSKIIKIVIPLIIATVVSGDTILAIAQSSESFDKPIHQTIVNLGKSPYLTPNSPSRIQLFCYYYSDFMIKQLNYPGLKGMRWVTITPLINNQKLPPCRVKYAPTERFMAKEWWAFDGVKGTLMFLNAADGDDNFGMPFHILDLKTGKKIFEDSSTWNGDFQFSRNADGSVSIKYLRVVGHDCSIQKDGINCWRIFRKHYGLLATKVPKCTGYRKEGEKEWVVGDKGMPTEEIMEPSTITYPVVVDLFPRPSIKAVPGPVTCSAI